MSSIQDLATSNLRSLGYSGSLPDMQYAFFRANNAFNEQEWLRARTGLNGPLNDLKTAYLKSLGYSGSLHDMFRQSLLNSNYYFVPAGTWILLAGTWNDSGQWNDASTWNDGI